MSSIYYNDSHCYDPIAGEAIGNIRRQKRSEKKRLRDMTWKDYGITKYRYRELKNFCLQYPEKLEQIRYGLPAVSIDGMPGSGKIGRPTEEQAIHNNGFLLDCEMIEQAAKEAAPDIYPWILVSVTEDLSYDELEFHPELGRIHVGRTEFYAYRRLFYKKLHDKKKLGTN